MAEIALVALLRGLGEAVRGAQDGVAIHAVERFRELLVTDPQGGGRPQMIALPFPCSDGSYVQRDIPVATLMHHDSVHLDEVRVKFSARLGWDEGASAVTVELGPPRRPGDEGPPEPRAEIELLLKRGDTPEGTARTTRELLKTI